MSIRLTVACRSIGFHFDVEFLIVQNSNLLHVWFAIQLRAMLHFDSSMNNDVDVELEIVLHTCCDVELDFDLDFTFVAWFRSQCPSWLKKRGRDRQPLNIKFIPLATLNTSPNTKSEY